jgi:hypothetical protein
MTCKRSISVLAVGAVAASAGLGACTDDPIDEAKVTQRLGVQVEQMVRTSGRGVGFTVAEDGTVTRALNGTSNSVDGVVSPMGTVMPPPPMGTTGMPAPMMRALVGRSLMQQLTPAPPMPTMKTAEEQFDEIGAELRQLFDERLFVPSNLESKDGGVAYYRLQPEPTCRPLPADTDPPGTVPPVDMDCAKQLTDVEVRLALREDGDGGRITVLIGPNRLELVAFVVHSDLLALEVDLAKAKAASDHIQQRLGQDAPTENFKRLAGKVRLSLKKVGDQKVTGAIAIVEALDIASADDSTDPGEVRVGVSNPLLAVTGDGVTKTATVEVQLGRVDVRTKWDPMGVGAINRDAAILVDGAYGKFTVDENAKRIDITDAGFGNVKMSVRDMALVDVNLNSGSQRRFSGSITVNADDTPHIEIRPEFDLTLAFDYASVAGELSTPPDPATLLDTYGVLLAAPGGTAVMDGVNSTPTFNGGVKMVTGSLTFSAAGPPPQMVTVPEGRCLTTLSPVPADAHPFLGSLQVVDCP